MTKEQLVAEVWERHGGLSRAEAARAVEAMLNSVVGALAAGRPVRIRDFGAFELSRRAPRIAVMPGQPERVTVPARRRLRFQAGSRLARELGTVDPVGGKGQL